jgi:CMP/dCMP kinase
MTFDEALNYLKSLDELQITLSGDIGSGKSTFGKHLAEDLGIERIYIGALMREEAARQGITLEELNTSMQADETIDKQMDALQKERSMSMKKGLFEGRTSWYFVDRPTVRIFLKVDPSAGATRVWGDSDNKARDTYDSLEDVVRANTKRKASEVERFAAYYDIDVYNETNFDVIIDTSTINIEEVYEQGVIAIAEFLRAKS